MSHDALNNFRYALLGASGCGKTTTLSCTIGMLKFDSGNINIFGNAVDESFVSRYGHKVGFMPQETALIPELTVKETIYFFGHLYQMNVDMLRQRYLMLRKLLELPPDYQRVVECSGGQQRRVSFCVSVIHDPELLILDEPTVGLDPVLREKIWYFMLHATRDRNKSIIITTHYIEEARQADRCGLMRHGVLLAEDSPTKIMKKYECETLEQAFLKLCNSQNEKQEWGIKTIDCEQIEDNNLSKPVSQISEERKKFTSQTFKALVIKNFTQIKRQPE